MLNGKFDARLFDTPLPKPDPEYLPLMPGTRVD